MHLCDYDITLEVFRRSDYCCSINISVFSFGHIRR